MTQPIEFIHSISAMAPTIFIWTHYYDDSLRGREELAAQFEIPKEITVDGKRYTVCKRNYQKALDWAGFCGGGKPWALWLSRDSLFRALNDCGLDVAGVSFDDPNHPNGPSLALVARRR